MKNFILNRMFSKAIPKELREHLIDKVSNSMKQVSGNGALQPPPTRESLQREIKEITNVLSQSIERG
jgi:hypothetical protein